MGHSPVHGHWIICGDVDELRPVISIGDDVTPGYYVIDRQSRVYSLYTGQELVQIVTENGYKAVSLTCTDGSRIQRRVHRLTMMTFCYFSGCENFEVNHVDGNKFNNDITNLEWITTKGNVRHAIDHNLRPSWGGENNPKAVFTEIDVQNIISLALQGYGNKEIAKMYGGNESSISALCQGQTWSHIATPEVVAQIHEARWPTILTDEQKHMLCLFYQNHPLETVVEYYHGAKKMYVEIAMQQCGIPYTESRYRIAARLFRKTKGQDPEIVSQYNYSNYFECECVQRLSKA